MYLYLPCQYPNKYPKQKYHTQPYTEKEWYFVCEILIYINQYEYHRKLTCYLFLRVSKNHFQELQIDTNRDNNQHKISKKIVPYGAYLSYIDICHWDLMKPTSINHFANSSINNFPEWVISYMDFSNIKALPT